MHSHSDVTTRKAAQKLWNSSFQDDEAFTQFYFDRRYSDDIHLAIYQDEQMIAGLQMIPYPFCWRGGLMQASYISGACTDPAFRKQKAMQKLIEKTHQQMYQEGIALSTLIPAESWLFNYYARFGYQSLFNYLKIEIAASTLTQIANFNIEEAKQLSTEAYRYIDRIMRNRSCSILHTEKDIADVVDALRLYNGTILVAKDGEELCGVAFIEKQEDTIIVKELVTHSLYTSYQVVYALLKTTCKLFQVEKIIWYKPIAVDTTTTSLLDSSSIEGKMGTEVTIEPLGMLRIINMQQLLQRYAEINPLLTAYIYLEGDTTLPINNGYYTIENGSCKKIKIPQISYQAHNIDSLTQLIFASEAPYMSLMID